MIADMGLMLPFVLEEGSEHMPRIGKADRRPVLLESGALFTVMQGMDVLLKDDKRQRLENLRHDHYPRDHAW